MRQRILTELLDSVEGVVRFGDTKASLFVAANTLLAAAYATIAKALEYNLNTIGAAEVGGIVAALLLDIALFLSLIAVTPNWRHWIGSRKEMDSVLLYSSIAKDEVDGFKKKVCRKNDADWEEELLAQIHSKARFAHR